MKSRYMKPETEVVRAPWLMAGDYNLNTNTIDGGTDADARSNSGDFFEEETNGKGFGYRRYNLWE